jgi:hypothetical protein
LAAVAVIVVVGYANSEPAKPLVSRLPAPYAPLSKPEPGSILARSDLGLSKSQRKQIAQVDSAWLGRKAEILRAMSAFQPKQGRVEQISASLNGYTELSRSYDSQRAMYWEKALAFLDAHQRTQLGGGKP